MRIDKPSFNVILATEGYGRLTMSYATSSSTKHVDNVNVNSYSISIDMFLTKGPRHQSVVFHIKFLNIHLFNNITL